MGTMSFRNFEVGEQFKKEFKECSKEDIKGKWKCESDVRKKYREVESGRLEQMGDKVHNFISKLDEDEVVTFKRKFPDAVKIANEFAVIEELREF